MAQVKKNVLTSASNTFELYGNKKSLWYRIYIHRHFAEPLPSSNLQLNLYFEKREKKKKKKKRGILKVNLQDSSRGVVSNRCHACAFHNKY